MVTKIDRKIIIKGKRIYLRRFKFSDARVLLKWGENSRYHQMAGFETFNNLSEAKRAVKQYVDRDYSFVVCLNENHEVIGLVELYERGMDERSGLLQTKEIGFLLDQVQEGNGYMTEALNLVISYAFNQLDQTEIWAGTFTNNDKSQHLLEKLGFKYLYTTDYAQISALFSYQEKYYLLKRADWLKMVSNTKS